MRLELDLRDNVNHWGAPPTARRVIRALTTAHVNTYPSVGANAVATALATAIGVAADEVVVGCGSDDVIDSAFRGLAAPGTRVAYSDPTFSMVPVFATANGLVPAAVPPLATGEADVDALLATGAPLIYLCSPNNPTGAVTPLTEVRRLIAAAPGVVLIDEAYAEFAGLPDWRAEAPAMGNVLVTRTFSKAWGLAGLRVGYAVGARPLVTAVARVRGPYKVNGVAEPAVLAALRHDVAWQRRTVAAATRARDRLAERLHALPRVRVWPSRANFAFLQVPGSARVDADWFASRGVGVRPFEDLATLGDAIRIGVAPWERLRRVAALAEERWA